MQKCEYAKYCGACQLQGKTYDEQLQIKQKKLISLLGKFHHVNDIIGMKNPLNYRNKVQVSLKYDPKNGLLYGNYVKDTHIIVPINDCMICDKKALEIISSVSNLILKYKISIFNEDILKGSMRHILVKCTSLNEYMVVLVSGTKHIKNLEQLVKEIVHLHPEVITVVLNVNYKHTSMILSEHNYVLYGKGYIVDRLCGLKFRISASSFYQVNKSQTEVLYKEIIKAANLKPDETIIDAYCGTGTIGMVASRYVKEVIGVEINKDAIKDAINNARLNRIENCYFVNNDAGKFMLELLKRKKHIDTVIMDPPRTGSDIKFMSSMIKLSPNKIVYVSCNPETLADNLKYLKKYYQIKIIQPVDMFPYTNHVETVVLLCKND